MENRALYLAGDRNNATEKYIYNNQWRDAIHIIQSFTDPNHNRRIISVTKRTKAGMDGLMFAVATLGLLTGVVSELNSVRILTGMSNKNWRDNFKARAPKYLRRYIFHNNDLEKSANLSNLRKGLIIIDEVDAANLQGGRLSNVLNESELLFIPKMEERDNRILVASATMIAEDHQLYRWGDLHYNIRMETPSLYIGHGDFATTKLLPEQRIGGQVDSVLQESYPIKSLEDAIRWLEEDVKPYELRRIYRVHLIRCSTRTEQYIRNACIKYKYISRTYVIEKEADGYITQNDIVELFKKLPRTQTVILVKGRLRRANLLPDEWKRKIGAVHESRADVIKDYNSQIQGLVGRMTGYWRPTFFDSSNQRTEHMAGPYRMYCKAVEAYENYITMPLLSNYTYLNGDKIKKKHNRQTKLGDDQLFDAEACGVSEPRELPPPIMEHDYRGIGYRTFADEDKAFAFARVLGAKSLKKGRSRCALPGIRNHNSCPRWWTEVKAFINQVHRDGSSVNASGSRNYSWIFPCYGSNYNNKLWVVKVQSNTKSELLREADISYPEDRVNGAVDYTLRECDPPVE